MKKLMIFLLFFVIAIGFLFYSQSTVSGINESLWLTEYAIMGHAFQLVDILIGFTTFFVSVMVILLFVILINRRRMENRQKVKDELLIKYQQLVLDYIEDGSSKEEFNVLKELTTSKFKRQLLIDQIVDVAKHLKDENLKNIQELYYLLKLHKVTFKKIKRGHWHTKISGIKEICALSLKKETYRFYKYANSKKDILRMEAQTALVELSRFDLEDNPFEFLKDLTVPFSLWEQITLHQSMIEKNIVPPDFKEWLFSDNPTVILFCLRMIREFKQTRNCDLVKDLAWHDDEEIRHLTYQVLGDLKCAKELKLIRKFYKDETIDNRREMIRSMRKTGDAILIQFLKKVIDSEEDAEILVEGVRAIKDMGNVGKTVLNKMLTDEYKNYNIIIKHVMDRKIT